MRKQNVLLLLLGFVLIVTVSGCKKEPICPSVEGHWRLEKFTILKSNKTILCDRMFYGITRMVTEVSEKQGSKNYGSFIARTEYLENETKLVLKDFKVYGYNTDKRISATSNQLRPFGIDNPKQTIFKILKSSKGLLIIESNYAKLVLKKF